MKLIYEQATVTKTVKRGNREQQVAYEGYTAYVKCKGFHNYGEDELVKVATLYKVEGDRYTMTHWQIDYTFKQTVSADSFEETLNRAKMHIESNLFNVLVDLVGGYDNVVNEVERMREASGYTKQAFEAYDHCIRGNRSFKWAAEKYGVGPAAIRRWCDNISEYFRKGGK